MADLRTSDKLLYGNHSTDDDYMLDIISADDIKVLVEEMNVSRGGKKCFLLYYGVC